jgi:tRNA-Thr(GGU) m(6)t(6)A37 methyltransferase TsaA
VLYWFHLRDNPEHRKTLQVTPPRHEGAPLTGVFACRSPSRPNPIGVTVVKIERIDGCKIIVSGLDALEGSPIIDIKPYNPKSDSVPEAEVPSYMKHF